LKIKYSCGCSVRASSDGYGGIDATDLELCPEHLSKYVRGRKKN